MAKRVRVWEGLWPAVHECARAWKQLCGCARARRLRFLRRAELDMGGGRACSLLLGLVSKMHGLGKRPVRGQSVL